MAHLVDGQLVATGKREQFDMVGQVTDDRVPERSGNTDDIGSDTDEQVVHCIKIAGEFDVGDLDSFPEPHDIVVVGKRGRVVVFDDIGTVADIVNIGVVAVAAAQVIVAGAADDQIVSIESKDAIGPVGRGEDEIPDLQLRSGERRFQAIEVGEIKLFDTMEILRRVEPIGIILTDQRQFAPAGKADDDIVEALSPMEGQVVEIERR